MQSFEMFQFKGVRNDVGQKFVPNEYFYETSNVNQDNIIGSNKALCPILISQVDANNPIDGVFKFNYLRSSEFNNTTIQKIINEEIIVCGGAIYRNVTNPTQIYTGMSLGKCTATVLNDKLFICNGINYPKVYNGTNVYEMGAPEAIVQATASYLNGSYYYAMTYVTAGGEEVLGTISNIVNPNNNSVLLNLPIGYTGTLSRKIYRTVAGGTELKLVDTIADNNTLTYTDVTADSALGATIPPINNECPKPKFITTSFNFRLIAVGDKTYPTQAFITDTNLEVFDKANFTDITNRGNDNTAITGLSDDYSLIVIGSKKQIYFLDVTSTPTVTITRANIGVLDGYSMVKMPSNSGFAGGVMFVGADRTVRVMNGNYSDPVPTSLDNIKTENWAQAIRGTLENALGSYNNIHAEYYDYKYHLVIDDKFFVYDTRLLGWHFLEYRTENNLCTPNVIVNFDNNALYIGKKNNGYIEKMYSDTLYMNEDLPAYIKFPYWLVSEDLKFFRELHLYYVKQTELDIQIKINIGDNTNSQIVSNVSEISTSVFDSSYYDSNYYETGAIKEDYKVIYLNKWGTWINIELIIPAREKTISIFDSRYYDPNYYSTDETNDEPFGNMAFLRGFRVLYDDVTNKENK